jgi:chloramphenicol 3-O-phosphotransferase
MARTFGHAHSELAADALDAHLFGPVLSFALLRRGIESLHATALTINGDAIALLGDSGAGKSTLAAALLARGARLLTDDLLVVKYEAGVPMAQPGLRRLKLMPDAAGRWPQNGAGAPFHPGSPKRVFRLTEDSCARASAPLRACFVLKRGAPTASARLLASSAGMQQIAANAFNTLDVRSARLRAHFEACARLSRHVPVFELSLTEDLLRIEEAVQVVGATLANTLRSRRA